jgi:hypothetical protein
MPVAVIAMDLDSQESGPLCLRDVADANSRLDLLMILAYE